jgi:GxxExxY protein
MKNFTTEAQRHREGEELKSVEKLLPVHQAQLLTYMKLANKRVGLLINFNVPLLTQGIVRRIL